jgi:lipopolysaccharide/colanic/teichoic acid biosynthesis glycosyltransferase
MVVDAEEQRKELAHLNEMDGPVFKIRRDPRVTRVGSILRKLSIDELPQLINVLKGEMSLVGPRPPLLSEVNLYDWSDRRRLSIKPGITCLWQISGRNDLTFEEWMKLDCKYIDNWSVWLDMKILLRTVPVVLFGKGAS